MKSLYSLIILFLFSIGLQAQTYTISGYLKEVANGETIFGANIYDKANPGTGTTSNLYGFYSLTLPPGEYTIVFSYLGFETQERKIDLQADLRLNIDMSEGMTLQEVVVKSKQKDQNVSGTKMGTVEIPVDQIKLLPTLMGEVDILKTLQLLPGVMSAGEGTAGFYVRGGGPDQNLVLLDEAVVYNSGHMLGFFSVFNSDAIKNTTLIKGGMPPYYGGRLSSVVDVQMKEGNNQNFGIKGGIGAIASRLTVEGPIQKDKSSFILSGRRTYAFDLAQPFLKGSDFEGTNYYFYDLNAKVNYRFSDKDRLFLSGYFGRDVLNYNSVARGFYFNMPYGNNTATLRWNHLFSEKLFMNVSAIYNEYDFSFEGGQDQFTVNVFSGVRDYNGKIDFDFYPNPKHAIKFGINYTYHKLTPNIANATSGDVEFANNLEPRNAHEGAIYLQDDFKVSDRLSVLFGLRATGFAQIGPYVSPFDGEVFGENDIVATYTGLEPRVNVKYSIDPKSSVKGGFALNNQYLHLVSNSSSTLPTDIWVPSTQLIKPQRGYLYALGYFRNFRDNIFEASAEIYYKDLQNQLDYRENYVNDIADDLEQQFVVGTGRSYGVELFVRKNEGQLTGWLGYTLSRTDRTFPDIRNGETFPARFDRRHDLSVVASYQLNPKWNFGAVFVYGTGSTFTPIKSLFFIEQELALEYGKRNSARIDAYHRIDFSVTFTPRPDSDKPFKSSWNFSVYNAYNRFNPFFIYYVLESDLANGTAKATANKVALFPIIPSITWNFEWKGKKKPTPQPLIKD